MSARAPSQSAKNAGRDEVIVENLERADPLFVDTDEAVDYLKQYEERLMKH